MALAAIVTDAVPAESVSAVCELGVIVANAALVMNVTTMPLAGEPLPFFTTAFTKPGLALEMDCLGA